jgi:hypothetical protein
VTVAARHSASSAAHFGVPTLIPQLEHAVTPVPVKGDPTIGTVVPSGGLRLSTYHREAQRGHRVRRRIWAHAVRRTFMKPEKMFGGLHDYQVDWDEPAAAHANSASRSSIARQYARSWCASIWSRVSRSRMVSMSARSCMAHSCPMRSLQHVQHMQQGLPQPFFSLNRRAWARDLLQVAAGVRNGATV